MALAAIVPAGGWIVRTGTVVFGLYLIAWTVDSVEEIATSPGGGFLMPLALIAGGLFMLEKFKK